MKRVLSKMTHAYEEIAEEVKAVDDSEFTDFHARRLVEIAGNIIMGHLLLQDAMRDNKYKNVAELFIKAKLDENNAKIGYIRKSDLRDLGTYKQVISEEV